MNGKCLKVEKTEIIKHWNATDTSTLKRCCSSSDCRPQSDLALTERFERCCCLCRRILTQSHTHTHIYYSYVGEKEMSTRSKNGQLAMWLCVFHLIPFHFILLYIKFTFVALHHAYITWMICVCESVRVYKYRLCSYCSVYGMHKCECDWHEQETIEINHTGKKIHNNNQMK